MWAKQRLERLALSRPLRLVLTAGAFAGRPWAEGSSGQPAKGNETIHLSAGCLCVQGAPLHTPESNSLRQRPSSRAVPGRRARRAAGFEVQPPRPEGTAGAGAGRVAAGSAGPGQGSRGGPPGPEAGRRSEASPGLARSRLPLFPRK